MTHVPELPLTADWRERAACRGDDPEAWFAYGQPRSRANGDPYGYARSVCRSKCPADVVVSCLNYALESRSDEGMFGALDPDERDALRRRVTS